MLLFIGLSEQVFDASADPLLAGNEARTPEEIQAGNRAALDDLRAASAAAAARAGAFTYAEPEPSGSTDSGACVGWLAFFALSFFLSFFFLNSSGGGGLFFRGSHRLPPS